MEITVRYQPSLEELGRATQLADTKRRAFRLIVTMVALLGAAVSVLIHANPVWTFACLGAVIGANVGQWTQRKRSEQTRLRSCVPTTATFTNEYFVSEGPTWQVRKQWTDFAKTTETSEFFLLYNRSKVKGYSPHSFYAVPKRAFDPADIETVSRFLMSSSGQPA